MNRTYRLVWNRALRVMQVASELATQPRQGDTAATASRRPRRLLAVACAVALSASLAPLPAWATVGGSQGGIGGSGGGAYGGSGGNGNGTGGGGGSGLAGDPSSNGNGGAGGHGGSAISAGGAGGSVGATTIGTTSVTGGNGMDGQTDPGTSFMSGGGGGGGDGVYTADTNLVVGAGLIITGGNGGNAGNGDRIGGGGGGGGAGLVALSDATVLDNAGSILGGNGGNGGNGQWSGGGGGGGDGILMSGANDNLTNSGQIIGGAGGAAGPAPGSLVGAPGEGGAGIDLAAAGADVTNSGSITGGNAHILAGAGIASDNGGRITNQLGGSIVGGDTLDNYTTGGSGIVAATIGAQTFVIDNAGTIRGGTGAQASGGYSGNGTGGTGIQASGNLTLGNGGLIEGGQGGSNGGGGRGGIGIAITVASGEQANITNRSGGVIRGGYGGVPGTGNYGGYGIVANGNVAIVNQSGAAILGDDGGLSDISTSGGTAIVATGGASIDNSGTIAGTGGIYAGTAISANAASIVNHTGGTIQGGNGQGANAGAAAIIASGQTSIDNSGHLVGGVSSADGTQAAAVVLVGGGNTLLLRAGSSITGSVLSSSGSGAGGDSFILGGDANAAGGNTFDAGTASGFASYQKAGASTWTLTGTGSAAQNWSIAAGILVGDSSSLVGNIDDGAALVFDQAADGNFSGIVSGSGSLTKSGTGVLTLTGTNTYGGRTTIHAGALALTGTGSIATSSGLLDDGTFDISGTSAGARIASLGGSGTVMLGGQTLTLTSAHDSFAGVIAGDGKLVLEGGRQVLTGANTYTGGTSVVAGTLVGDATSLRGAINDDATLSFVQAVNASFDGTLSGRGTLLKSGTGTLTINGTNPFAGATTVQAGTLVVGDDSHATATLGGTVTVATDATLGGIGTLGGLDLAGTLSPGNSVGTLHVSGDATIQHGASLRIEATPDGHADQLAVGGKIAIQGGSALVLAQSGNWAPRTDYTIVTAAGGVSGQFASASSSLAFLDPVLSYSANAVNLSLQRNDVGFADAGITPNQKAAAQGAESRGWGTPVYDALVKLDVPQARRAFDQLSGEIYPTTLAALAEDDRYVRDAINRHLLGLGEGVDGRTADGTSAWLSTWGHWGRDDGDSNAASLRANGSGLLLGVDRSVGTDSRLGLLLGHGQNSMDVAGRTSSAHVLNHQLGVYGDTASGALRLRAAAVHAWQDVDTQRTAAFSGFDERLASRRHLRTDQAYVEAGYRFTTSHGHQWEPFVNLARTQQHAEAAREHGGQAALAVAAADPSVNSATLGLRDTFTSQAGVHVQASLAWQHGWGDLASKDDMRFVAGGDSFVIAGVPLSHHALLANLGIDFQVARNVTVDASYLGQFASGYRDQGARMGLTVTF